MPAGHRRPRAPRKRAPRLSREERSENVLRPSPYLGYNRDEMGVYFMDRDAHHTAEQQFRRAVWLNPYEPEFKVHLAWCLYQQHRDSEALTVVNEAIEQMPQHPTAEKLRELIRARQTSHIPSIHQSNEAGGAAHLG